MKILLVQTGFLGDVVLSTPVIKHLHDIYPDAKITFLTTPAAAALVRHHPGVEDVIVFDKRGTDAGFKGLIRLSRKIRLQKFCKVFSLHKSWRTAALLYLSGIPERFGFSEASGGFLYTKLSSRKDLAHEVLRNLAILRSAGLVIENLTTPLHVATSVEAETVANQLLGSDARPRIGIAPGSVWATKRWETSGFAAVAKHFSKLGYSIILLGGKADSETISEVEKLSGCEVINLAGKSDLLQSAAIIKKLDLLVSNDSAPLHLASAAGTPVVASFCATVPEFGFGPWQTPHKIVEVKNLKCRPCGSHGGNVCPTGTRACMKNLEAAEVIAACEELLSRARSCQIQSAGTRNSEMRGNRSRNELK